MTPDGGTKVTLVCADQPCEADEVLKKRVEDLSQFIKELLNEFFGFSKD